MEESNSTPYDPEADHWTPPPVQHGDRAQPDDERLRELVQAGTSTADIMAELGCRKQRVYRMRARLGVAPPTTLDERIRRASSAAAVARAEKKARFLAVLREAPFDQACAAAGYSPERGAQVLATAVRAARVEAVREHPTHLTEAEAAAWRARRVNAAWKTRRTRRAQ